MKPWVLVFVAGTGFNLLVIIGFLLSGRSGEVTSLIAGALPPVMISAILLYWAGSRIGQVPEYFQKLNIIGFILKVLLFGGWATVMITGGTIHNITFIIMLLINFLAWHGVEAYYWPLFMHGNERATGEKS